MRILGVDYGERKIGLAIAESKLAAPLKVISVNSIDEAVIKVEDVVEKEQVEEVVVGVSEGEMAQETRSFAQKLRKRLKRPIKFQDETLSSKDAEKLSIEVGIGRKKRKKMKHAYSAALILQDYLDENAT